MRKVLFVDDEIGFLENLQMLFSGDPDLEIAVVSDRKWPCIKQSILSPKLFSWTFPCPRWMVESWLLC